MTRMKRHMIVAGISLLTLFTALINAAEITQADHSAEHTASLDTHMHGLSTLTIVMESTSVEIELISPAMDLVGFEHRASSQQDIAAIENAAALLSQSETLFVFSGGRCVEINTSIDLASLIKDDNIHQHKSDAHEHNHDHENHTQHDSHSEIVANYAYHCENDASLSAITVALFEFFPGIDKIQTMWVKQTQQGATTLTQNNRIIKFR